MTPQINSVILNLVTESINIIICSGIESMANRTFLALTDDALKVIEANATERKRGEFVSNILVDYGRITGGISALGDDDDGILERIDSRLARIEKQMAILLAER